MTPAHRFRFLHQRVVLSCAITVGLLLAAPLSLASAAPGATGTLVGSVTCGSDDAAPAPNVVVLAEGSDLSTHTDHAGNFALVVPAAQLITVEAVAAPDNALQANRRDIVVQPGETLDIGALDLAVCPQPVVLAPAPADQEQRDL